MRVRTGVMGVWCVGVVWSTAYALGRGEGRGTTYLVVWVHTLWTTPYTKQRCHAFLIGYRPIVNGFLTHVRIYRDPSFPLYAQCTHWTESHSSLHSYVGQLYGWHSTFNKYRPM